MLSVLNIVLPVFLLVGVGYVAVRFARFPQTGIAGMIAFVNNYAAPCLLFRAMLEVDFGAVFDVRILGGFYIGSFSALGVGILVAILVFARKLSAAIIIGFSGAFTNAILLGFPILQRAYGEEALPVLFSIVAFQAPLMLTSSTIFLEFSRRQEAAVWPTLKGALRRIVTNPLVLGIGLGVLGNISGLVLPEALDVLTKTLAGAVVPVALFGLGGALTAYGLSQNWRQAGGVAAVKLFVHPAIAWVVMVPLLGVPIEIARYGVLLAAMPTGINAYIFSTTNREAEDVAANAILMTTLVSIASISIWLLLLSL